MLLMMLLKLVKIVNRFQAKLIKNNPSLFKKEIKKLYHEGKLESSLTLIYSSKIIKVLEEEKIYLKIDNLTRMSLLPLLEDSLFVDYILKYHIECLSNIPDKLLKDEYFKQYAMYLKNNDIDITTIKSKLLVHHEIANVVLLKINSLNDLEYFLDNVNDDNLLLKAIIIGEEKKLLNDNISEVFYKNATIFRKMLKIYGNKLLTKTTEEKLKEFIPIIADEIINNNLILNSNNVFLLKEPEIIKAILNSPNILKMPDIINCLIDINTLNENELISLTELIYYNFHHDPFTFAFISIDF